MAGISQLQNLVINSQSITVTGNPNQTVTLSNRTVIINKQTSSVGGTSASITVDALNVTTHDPVTQQELANVVLGTTNAQIDCSGGSQSTETWTTGGGWINAPTGGKGTFGVAGGNRSNGVDGHAVYKDHQIDFRVESNDVTSVMSGCTTFIEGNQGSGATAAQFTVTVTDGGGRLLRRGRSASRRKHKATQPNLPVAGTKGSESFREDTTRIPIRYESATPSTRNSGRFLQDRWPSVP